MVSEASMVSEQQIVSEISEMSEQQARRRANRVAAASEASMASKQQARRQARASTGSKVSEGRVSSGQDSEVSKVKDSCRSRQPSFINV